MEGINFSDGSAVQVFTPKKSFAPFALSAASKVLRFRGTLAGGELDLTGCRVVAIRPSTNDLTRHFGASTTLTRTVPAGQDSMIGVADHVETITITGTDTSIEIEAM